MLEQSLTMLYTSLIKLLNSNENINLYDYLRISDHVIYNITLESEYFDDPNFK